MRIVKEVFVFFTILGILIVIGSLISPNVYSAWSILIATFLTAIKFIAGHGKNKTLIKRRVP